MLAYPSIYRWKGLKILTRALTLCEFICDLTNQGLGCSLSVWCLASRVSSETCRTIMKINQEYCCRQAKRMQKRGNGMTRLKHSNEVHSRGASRRWIGSAAAFYLAVAWKRATTRPSIGSQSTFNEKLLHLVHHGHVGSIALLCQECYAYYRYSCILRYGNLHCS